MLRFWSTTTLAPAPASARARSMSAGLLATSRLNRTSPDASTAQARCDDLPTSKARRAAPGLALSSMVYPLLKLADRRPRERQPHYGAVGQPPACLYQSPAAASRPRRQHPPGLRERQGGRAVRGGRPATPRGRLQSYFQGLGEYKGAARGPAQTVMGGRPTPSSLAIMPIGDSTSISRYIFAILGPGEEGGVLSRGLTPRLRLGGCASWRRAARRPGCRTACRLVAELAEPLEYTVSQGLGIEPESPTACGDLPAGGDA